MTRQATDCGPIAPSVRVTPKLYACRDAARVLLGVRYRERMSEIGGASRSAAAAGQCSVLEAAAAAARDIDRTDALQVLAAAVELVELSA